LGRWLGTWGKLDGRLKTVGDIIKPNPADSFAIMSVPVKVFISYAREDKALRQTLTDHLIIYKRNKLLQIWDDGEIAAGEEWAKEIDEKLEQADIILCLVSKDFFSSNFCYTKEMATALQKHDAGRAVVIPILIRPYAWKTTPLSKLNAVPRGNKPVISSHWLYPDEAWTEVAKEIEIVARQIQAKSVSPSAHPTPIPTPPTPLEPAEPIDQGQGEKSSAPQPNYFTETLSADVRLEMVKVPGGSFDMGSPAGQGNDNEHPQHRVTLAPFWIGKYPVTQAQWQTVAALPKCEIDLNPTPSYFDGKDLPVEAISWFEAVEFCKRLCHVSDKIYRLPSEAEWEYACRAGMNSPFHFGETIMTDLANYYSGGNNSDTQYHYFKRTTPVGNFRSNEFGVGDMHGNVLEWCSDHWHNNYNDAPIDGSTWVNGGYSAYRTVRGGSWHHHPWDSRSASREKRQPDFKASNIGFRIVLSSL
jgi:formylglycine-generating enzyme required for sulfatase activity